MIFNTNLAINLKELKSIFLYENMFYIKTYSNKKTYLKFAVIHKFSNQIMKYNNASSISNNYFTL